MGIKTQRNRQAAIIKECREISEGSKDGPLSDDDKAKFDGLMQEHTDLQSSIDREEKLRALEAQAPPIDPPSAPPASNGEPGKTKEDPKGFSCLGTQLQAVHQAGIGGRIDPRLTNAAITGHGETIGSDGGFLVDTDAATDLTARVFNNNELLSRVNRIPIGPNSNGVKIKMLDETSRANGSRSGGIQMFWEAEAAEKTASNTKFRLVDLALKKLIGLSYATDELLADAPALQAVISSAFQAELAFKLQDGLVNGTGVGQLLGILRAACLVSVAKETNQAAGTIVKENIDKMWARMYTGSTANAIWLINQQLWPQLFNMSLDIGSGGSAVYLPPNGIAGAPFGTLYGRPVIPIEQCQALGTKGDIIFADFGQYFFADKGGMQTDSSIHVRFVYDETAFRWVFRADGQPAWNTALTPFKGGSGATTSPFVTLAAR